jgi:hypothetical protein
MTEEPIKDCLTKAHSQLEDSITSLKQALKLVVETGKSPTIPDGMQQLIGEIGLSQAAIEGTIEYMEAER